MQKVIVDEQKINFYRDEGRNFVNMRTVMCIKKVSVYFWFGLVFFGNNYPASPYKEYMSIFN